MKNLPFLIISSSLAVSSTLPGATVGFSIGDFISFQTTGGDQLQGGYLHAGYFETSPLGLGLSAADLQESFITWGTHSTTSNFGGFGSSDFPVAPIGAAANQQIFLAVTDSSSVADALQIAVFTNTSDADWTFPSSDDPTAGFVPSPSLDDVLSGVSGANVLAGSETTTDALSGILGRETQAIQLAAIPEPSVVSFALLSLGALLRRRR